MNESVADPGNADVPPPDAGKRRLRLILMLAAPLLVLIIAAWWYLAGGRYEDTDDAYVQMARVAISANIPGRVSGIDVHENQAVHRGDVLVHIDDAQLRVALEEAGAQLATAKLQLSTLKATYRQRLAELGAADSALAYQQHEYDRQQRLLTPGIASQMQVDRAKQDLDDARAKQAGARQQVAAALAALGGDPDIAPERHPAVRQAQAMLDRSRLNLSYTTVTAPADGIATRVDSLQVGTYIAAAAPLFAVVSPTDLWIEANFKEDQLTHMRAGQSARVRFDSYPGRDFNGHVESVSPGTGSLFSVLPPENATGNWVKVVQRLPVRIRLDHIDPAFPLQGGLSATVTVDTQHRRQLFGHGAEP